MSQAAEAVIQAAAKKNRKLSSQVPRKNTALRQSQILEELSALLALPGHAKASTAELAKRVGVTEPALYRHFENKAAMLSALLDYALHCAGQIDQGPPGAKQAAEFMESNPGLARLMCGDGLSGEGAILAAKSEQAWGAFVSKIGKERGSQQYCDWLRGALARWLASDRKAGFLVFSKEEQARDGLVK